MPNQLPNGTVSQGAEPVPSGIEHLAGTSPGIHIPRSADQEILAGGMNPGTNTQESHPESREETVRVGPAQP
jgi:hypothetical protein